MVIHLFNKILLFLNFIFIIQFNLILNNNIFIPFKIYHNTLDNNEDERFINEYISNNIYIEMQLSQPPQNIIAKINSLEFELLMKSVNKLPFDNLYSNFSQKESNTFTVISEEGNVHFPNSKYVKDNFNFCVKYDAEKKRCIDYKYYNNINFIYSDWEIYDEEEKKENNKDKYTYLDIGLNFKRYIKDKAKYSLFNNLIMNNYINNNNWFLYFFNHIKNDNIDYNKENNEIDDGLIVIGSDPIEYFGNKYNKSLILSCQGINTEYDYRNCWSIVFDELKQKTLKQDNKDVVIENKVQGVINYNYNAIVGNYRYMDIIEKTFFWPYMTKNICQKKIANNKFYYYACKVFSLSFNEIKENFPSLYFTQNEFKFTFELTPQDLFVQIGDEIFFLIVFYKNNPTNSFLLGNIFLQKYFFGFDNESKKISFFRENQNKDGTNSDNIVNDKEVIAVHWYNSSNTIIVMIFLIIIFSISCFYYGKKIYNRRKLRANELEDQFEYKSPLDQEFKKFNLEMKINF